MPVGGEKGTGLGGVKSDNPKKEKKSQRADERRLTNRVHLPAFTPVSTRWPANKKLISCWTRGCGTRR